MLSDRYRIISVLGSGGFGETFLAEDTQMPSERRCVIKQLKPITNNPQVYQLVQERFGREAAILEELGGFSNQIPTLYAYFQTAGQFYLIQEWISGQTLSQKVRQSGCVSETVVREILISLLQVLEYIHSKGIIHRDIKPDNIILRSLDAKPVLIDFGAVRETMATMVNSQGNVTTSIIIGTPGFMPNEQAAGRPVFASDLYSLGLTAIYLLTGKFPQQLQTDSYTGEIIWERNTVSQNLAAVLDKVINSHPRERFPTARAMLDALRVGMILPTQPVVVSPPFPETINVTPPSTQTISKNNLLIPSLIAGSLIGGSVIIGFVLTKSPLPIVQQTVSPSPQNDYSWLSQRRVIDADLVGKDGFGLDIMRNSIYARHGRRFVNSVLQQYFNSQSWYDAKYSTDEFDKLNLLSDLEKQNADYISAYQDRNKLRFIPISNAEQLITNTPKPNSFYFIADSALTNLPTANNKIKSLQAAGYPQAGVLWIPDYPNLSGKQLFEVYVATFSDRPSCVNLLKIYGQVNSQAYCAYASKQPNAPPDRIDFKEIN